MHVLLDGAVSECTNAINLDRTVVAVLAIARRGDFDARLRITTKTGTFVARGFARFVASHQHLVVGLICLVPGNQLWEDIRIDEFLVIIEQPEDDVSDLDIIEDIKSGKEAV